MLFALRFRPRGPGQDAFVRQTYILLTAAKRAVCDLLEVCSGGFAVGFQIKLERIDQDILNGALVFDGKAFDLLD